MNLRLIDQLKSFVSKKIAVGGAGVAYADIAQSEVALYVTIAYIICQAAVDCVKVWRNST